MGRAHGASPPRKLVGTSSGAYRQPHSYATLLVSLKPALSSPAPRRIHCPPPWRISPHVPIIVFVCRGCCVAAIGTSSPETSALPCQRVQCPDFPHRRSLANPGFVPVGVSTLGAAARAAGGMPEYGKYPSGTQAVGSNNKK